MHRYSNKKSVIAKGLTSALMMSGASIAFGASAFAQDTIVVPNGQSSQVEPDTGDTVTVASDVVFSFAGTGNDDASSNIRVDSGADNVTITNDGHLTNTNGNDEEVVVFVDNGEDSTIINNNGTMEGVDGVIFIEGDNATINNSSTGVIRGIDDDQTEGVIYLDRDTEGTFTINNDGLIETAASAEGATIGLDIPSASATASNSGVIPSVVINNTGTIQNLDTGNSDSDTININGDPGSSNACTPCSIDLSITNSGLIEGARSSSTNAAIRFEDDAHWVSGTITNTSTGVIRGTQNAIQIGSGFDGSAGSDPDFTAVHGGTIDNSGLIEATEDRAIRVDGGGITIINRAGGVITGPGEGIYFDQGSGDDAGLSGGTVENAGTISSAEAAITVRGQTGTTITNTGSLLGLDGSSDERAVLEVTGTAIDVTIVNAAGGDITTESGFTEEAVGIDATGADISFTNAGTVTALEADAVIISGGTLASFENSGTIVSSDGAAVTFDGADLGSAFMNSGTLQGTSASFDATDALSVISFVQNGGALVGDFIGSNAGTDSLNYAGGVVDLSHDILNDVDVTVSSGATINVVGARSIEGSLLSDGTIDFVLGTDSLNVTGDVTLNTGSTIQISDLNGLVTGVGDQFSLLTSGGTLTNSASLTDVTSDASFLLDFVVVNGATNTLTVEAIAAIVNSTVVANAETLVLSSDITSLTDLVVQGGGILDIAGARSLNGTLTSAGTLQFVLGTDSLDVSGNVELTNGSSIEIADLNGAVTGVGDQFTLLTSGGTLTNNATLIDTTADASFLLDFVMLPGMDNSIVVEAIAALQAITDAQILDSDIAVNTFVTVDETGILDIQGNRSIIGSLISDGTLQFTLGTDSLDVSGDVFLNSGSIVEINDLNGAVSGVGDQFTLITSGGTLMNDSTLMDITQDASFLLDFVVVDASPNSLIVEAVSAIAQDVVFDSITSLTDDITTFSDVVVSSDGELTIVGNRSIDGSLTSNGTLAFILGQDSLNVSGDVTLANGSTVQIDDLNGAVTGIGDEFTLITSGGTLTNGAALVDVTEDASFLVDFEVTGTENGTYTVVAVEADGTAAATNSIARPLSDNNLNDFGDAIISGFNGGLLSEDLFVSLAEIPDEEGFADATLALMPSATNAVSHEVFENQKDITAISDRRLLTETRGVWAQASQRSSELSQDSERRSLFGYDADTLILAFGADKKVGENIVVGASYGYTDGEIEHTRAAFNETSLTTHQFGVYGGVTSGDKFQYNNLFVTGGMNVVSGELEESRVGLNSAITSESDLSGFFLHGSFGLEREATDWLTVTGKVDMTRGDISQDEYTELGGLGLTVSPDDVTYSQTRFGIDAEAMLSESDTHTMRANVLLGISDNSDDNGQLFGVTSDGFSDSLALQAESIDAVHVDYGVGFDLVKSSGMNLRLEAHREEAVNADYANTTLLGRFKMSF